MTDETTATGTATENVTSETTSTQEQQGQEQQEQQARKPARKPASKSSKGKSSKPASKSSKSSKGKGKPAQREYITDSKGNRKQKIVHLAGRSIDTTIYTPDKINSLLVRAINKGMTDGIDRFSVRYIPVKMPNGKTIKANVKWAAFHAFGVENYTTSSPDAALALRRCGCKILDA